MTDETTVTTPTTPEGEGLSAEFKTAAKVSLDAIDQDDKTYQFRENLRIGPLANSLKENGLQVPVILKARGQGQKKYQLISGFRRCAAASSLDWLEIPAVVRGDLESDEEAFKAAVLENTNRKTYSDIDRAYVLLECRTRKLGDDALPMDLLGLKERQRKHLLSLLKLPKSVQDAIDDPDAHFSGTHGLVLKQLKGKYSALEYPKWVKAVNETGISVAQMKRMVKKEYTKKADGTGFNGLFRDQGTDEKNGEFRFNPVMVKVGEMSKAEKDMLKNHLNRVLKALE